MGKVESQSQVLPPQHLWSLSSAARLCTPGALTKGRDLGTDGLRGEAPSYTYDEIKPANDGNPFPRGTEKSFQVEIAFLIIYFSSKFNFPWLP